MKYKTKVILVIMTMAITLFVCGIGFYVDDYYKANETAIKALEDSTNINVEIEDDKIAFIPNDAEAGFIFYPGGKVEFSAYAPLLKSLAEENILCVVVKMPANLAVLDIDAAEGIPEMYPEVDTWYIGGHSLGGSMAATYLNTSSDTNYEGLVLLASYSTEDFSSTDMKVISIYGSEDKVLNHEKYEKYFSNLPNDCIEIIIDGANHANFGSYGKQKNDGDATIMEKIQITRTKEALLSFFEK